MLLNNFYTVLHRSGPEKELSPSGVSIERYVFSMELNPDHPVYEGHFPGNPVVPGVCQLQMISELLSLIKGSAVRLIHSDNVKFLSVMVPNKNRIIDAEIRVKTLEDGEISANAILKEGEVVFIKFKGLFRKEQLKSDDN
jgi:3-hydroxyacyl-[acyl-carrier-protein] dehydratase